MYIYVPAPHFMTSVAMCGKIVLITRGNFNARHCCSVVIFDSRLIPDGCAWHVLRAGK